MSRKQRQSNGSARWAPVWEGLFNDPKHHQRMGNSVWVYMYLVTQADTQTGRVDRLYTTIAEAVGKSVRSVERHLAHLERAGYIQKQKSWRRVIVQITKWRPPGKKSPAKPDGSRRKSPDNFVGLDPASPDNSDVLTRQVCRDHPPTLTGEGSKSEFSNTGKQKENPLSPDKSGGSIKNLYQESKTKEVVGGVDSESPADPEPVAADTPPPPSPPPEEGSPEVKNDFPAWIAWAVTAYGEMRGTPPPWGNQPVNPAHRRSIEHAAGGRHSWRTLYVAWSLFLLDDPPGCGWFRGKPARTLAMFVQALDDLLPAAVAEIDRRDAASNRPRTIWDQPYPGEPREPADPFAEFKRGPDEQAVWAAAREKLEADLLPENFKNWIAPLQFGGINCTRAGLYTLSDFMTRCLCENYGELVSAALSEAAGRDLQAVFAVGGAEGGG